MKSGLSDILYNILMDIVILISCRVMIIPGIYIDSLYTVIL
jgi:hypothetical protein